MYLFTDVKMGIFCYIVKAVTVVMNYKILCL
jgi:hypothetical protein